MVAHDFRDPLAALLAQVGALKRKAQVEESVVIRPADIERLERIGWRLDRLVSDLSDAMLIEAGTVPLRRQPMNVRAAVDTLLDRSSEMLAGHPVSVRVEGEPMVVLADPDRFEQILSNLLENAAKFSPEGAPIEVLVSGAKGGTNVAVCDRGVGIPEQELGRLFDRAYQSRRARQNKSGLGLGLYLTKGLIEAHGGSIRVESQLGRGSTFEVFFPAVPRAEAEARPTM
jgi:signal transduction histidine kinase